MTPKERADDLINKFLSITVSHYDDLEDGIRNGLRIVIAKNCALIAVDEMLANVVMIWGCNQARDEFRDYWHEVKQEIEKR